VVGKLASARPALLGLAKRPASFYINILVQIKILKNITIIPSN